MPTEPYLPYDDAIVVHRYRARDEYVRIRAGRENPADFCYTPFASGDLAPDAYRRHGTNAYENLLQWARLSGRFVHEVACSNPIPPKTCPTEILRVVHFHDPQKSQITKRIAIPQFIIDAWGTATPAYLATVIREHVRCLYEMSHTGMLHDGPKLDRLIEAQMRTPLGQTPEVV